MNTKRHNNDKYMSEYCNAYPRSKMNYANTSPSGSGCPSERRGEIIKRLIYAERRDKRTSFDQGKKKRKFLPVLIGAAKIIRGRKM